MEGYKRTKDQEALRLRKKLAGAEEDIKVLILEQDRQKKVANEKIKMLHDMFQWVIIVNKTNIKRIHFFGRL